MGYDLHITRKEYWFEEDQYGNDISLDELILLFFVIILPPGFSIPFFQ